MKLHVTLTSPYARKARVAIIEHRLQDDVEVLVAKTRQKDSPYYQIAPSGRVPFLELADGRSLEESDSICAYFDAIGHGPPLSYGLATDDWEYARLHGLAEGANTVFARATFDSASARRARPGARSSAPSARAWSRMSAPSLPFSATLPPIPA